MRLILRRDQAVPARMAAAVDWHTGLVEEAAPADGLQRAGWLDRLGRGCSRPCWPDWAVSDGVRECVMLPIGGGDGFALGWFSEPRRDER